MREWALNGLRTALIAYLIVQGVAGVLVERSIPIGVLFIVPGIACMVPRFNRIGFLVAALSQIVFVIGFQHGAPVYSIVAQVYTAMCLAWFYAMQKYVD
jgi:hypothetical protein